MMFKTHMAVAFLVAMFGIGYFAPYNQILFLVLVLFGAALVDIDHPQSKIGRRVKIIGHLFEHRGFFHSLFALPLLALLIYKISGNLMFAIPILLGYLSHIIGDAMTVDGIMPLHPLTRFRIRGFFRTGTRTEHVFFLIIVAIDTYSVFSF